jgi:hypothetical protein
MTINELYDKLCDKGFRDFHTGDLFSRYYIYLYPPQQEYAIRRQMADLAERLKRPNEFIEVILLNVFEEFCNHLKQQPWGKSGSLFDFLLNRETAQPADVRRTLTNAANNDRFLKHLNDYIHRELQGKGTFDRDYVFLHGFGEMFPYLRVNKFMVGFEKYPLNCKLILFYPGTYRNGAYSLFDQLPDANPYRAIKLLNV